MQHRARSLAVGCLAALCGLACTSSSLPGSGATGGTGGTVACGKTTPYPPAVTGDMVRDTAQANEFGFVDGVVGGYLRGDSPTYVGTASATDTSAALSFSTGSAIAAVVITSTWAVGVDWALFTVASPADHERLILGQQATAPEVTIALGIGPDGSYPGGYSDAGTCTSCTPDFFTRPSSLAWSGVDANYPGFYPDGGGVFPAYDVTSSVDLQALSPCALTWDQIVALNGGPRGFVQEGNEMVVHASGSIQTVAPSFRMCDGQAVPYTIDRYINLTNLFDYGLRNYVAGSPTSVCGGA
jgi:hypothetical protein